MRNRIVIILLLIAIFMPLKQIMAQGGISSGGVTSTTARHIRYSASAPATCSPSTGDIYWNTTDKTLYVCTEANTWSASPSVAASPTFAGLNITGSIYDVRTYGAVCNGSNDDTVAVQAAITAARGDSKAATVMLPWGKCKISSTINLLDGVNLAGVSKHMSGLVANSAITMISSDGLSTETISNLRLENSSLNTGTGIAITSGSHQVSVKDVYFYSLQYGVTVAWDSATLDDLSFYKVDYPIVLSATANSTYIKAPRIDTCVDGISVGMTGALRGVAITGGTIQGCTNKGIDISSYASDVAILNTYFETNGVSDIETEGTNVLVSGGATSSDGTGPNVYVNSVNGASISNFRFVTQNAQYAVSLGSSARNVILDNLIYDAGVTSKLTANAAATYKQYDAQQQTYHASDMYSAFGLAPAQTGAIRLSNNTGIYERNASGSDDLPLIKANSSNSVTVGGTGTGDVFVQSGSGIVYLRPSVAVGSNTATAGTIRLSNNQSMYGSNAAGNGNIQIIGTTSADAVTIANSSMSAVGTGGSVTFSAKPIFSSSSAPATTDACTAGSVTWDTSYAYVCTASGAWKKISYLETPPYTLTETANAIIMNGNLASDFTVTMADDNDGATLTVINCAPTGRRLHLLVNNAAAEVLTYGTGITVVAGSTVDPLSASPPAPISTSGETDLVFRCTGSTAAKLISIYRDAEP